MVGADNVRPVALVTGSGTGVGRACVVQFAQRGFDVIVNYSRSATEADKTAHQAAEFGGRVLIVCCDVSDDQAVRMMVERIENEFGRLDVLVNNAAMTHFVDHGDLDGMTEPMWDRILNVNLKGPFFVTRAASKLLATGQSGAVVNVSSVAGETGKGSSIAYGHPFAATGARIVGNLAKLLGEHGGRGLISICTAGGMGVAAILEAAKPAG